LLFSLFLCFINGSFATTLVSRRQATLALPSLRANGSRECGPMAGSAKRENEWHCFVSALLEMTMNDCVLRRNHCRVILVSSWKKEG
jgi:hypothetical protein